VANSGRPNQTTQEEFVIAPFLTLTALPMPTPCATFGALITLGQSQDLQEPATDVKVFHRTAEPGPELLEGRIEEDAFMFDTSYNAFNDTVKTSGPTKVDLRSK
jgi:hypothetical protein